MVRIIRHRRPSETSDAMWEKVRNSGKRQPLYRWLMVEFSTAKNGLTHEEIAELWDADEHAPDSSPSGLRTRVSELVNIGFVRDSGRKRLMKTGNQAIVWILT